MTRTLDADYLVVGAGAMGMAFTDAVLDHSDARVVLVDRRHGVGGHWLGAYPFVRLHQASAFYGVASTLLGGLRVQLEGPEAGLQERATVAEILVYYERVLADRMLPSGRVEFLPSCAYGDDRTVTSLVSGQRYAVPARCRVVDAHYLAPDIPAESAPPFTVSPGARVVPVGELTRLTEPPERYVVVGSGKTATDACIWLLDKGVDPDAITWVRPRDPWMLNRATAQPEPTVFLAMVADTLQAASGASSLDDLFLRLEGAGVMLRIDRSVTPTMGRTPTLAVWELELLRTIEHVVRLGRVRRVEPGRIILDAGAVDVPADTLVVHCASYGLQNPPPIPIWGPSAITLQPIRSGFPCFGAALAGYVEATRADDAEKNRLCPSSTYGNSLADWAAMTVLGARAAQSFGSEPDIAAWANAVLLNPARVPPERHDDPAVQAVLGRLRDVAPTGVARLAALAGLS